MNFDRAIDSGEMAPADADFSDILIHIGYHKTGSTYLQDHCFQPINGYSTDIGGSRTRIVKDIAFPDNFTFDHSMCRSVYLPYIETAREKGLRFVLSHERLSGYPPSGGYDRILIADRLVRTFPSARILIVVREQVSLIRSIYSQYITDGGDLSLDRFLETPEPQLGRMPGFRLEVYEFDRLIRHYQELFGRVLVVPFEMMVRDLEGFVGQITQFMEMPPPASIAKVVTNSRRPVTMQVVQRFANRLMSNNELSRGGIVQIPRFARRFARLQPIFERLTPKAFDERLYKNIDQKIRAFVAGHYRDSNDRVIELTGLDLEKFGYAV
ncbi:sulfotransferase [Ensifer canadensis]